MRQGLTLQFQVGKTLSRRSRWQDLRRALWLALLAVALAGCYQPSNYSGDGRLIDNGIFAATDRYVLDLGQIDLGRSGSKKYRLENLPESDFVLGIEIAPVPGSNEVIDNESMKSLVTLELTPLEGEPIFSKKGSLNTWTWSSRDSGRRMFVYGREGPRTYFKPNPSAAYTLTLTVVQPNKESSRYAASLIAKAGGWK